MYKAWLLVVTRDLRVHMPPELYENLDRAELEGRRWLSTVLGWRPASNGALVAGSPAGTGRYLLHMKEFELPNPWRACPLWACVKWSAKAQPRIHLEIIAASQEEAHDWVNAQTRKSLVPARCGEWRVWTEVGDGSARTHVASHRIKVVKGI